MIIFIMVSMSADHQIVMDEYKAANFYEFSAFNSLHAG